MFERADFADRDHAHHHGGRRRIEPSGWRDFTLADRFGALLTASSTTLFRMLRHDFERTQIGTGAHSVANVFAIGERDLLSQAPNTGTFNIIDPGYHRVRRFPESDEQEDATTMKIV